MRFWDLVYTEAYKLLRQRKTYFAVAAILVIELIVIAVALYQGQAVLDTLLRSLQDSFLFQGELLNGNLLTYFLLNSLWFHIPLILMIVLSGSITSEFEDKSIQTVFLQPVSKTRFLLAKYLVAAAFTELVVVILAITSFAISYGFFGKGDLVVLMDSLNFFESEEAFTRLCWAFVTGIFTMVFFTVMSITFGVIFRDSVRTWIVSALVLIVCNLLTQIEIPYLAMDQWFLPKLLNTWQLFFDYDIAWSEIARNLSFMLLYTIGFAWWGVYVFNKRPIG